MTRLRSLLHARRWLPLTVGLLALAVRIVVPAGMMPGHGAGGATLIVCSGQMTGPAAMPGMAMPGDAGRHDPGRGDAGKSEPPCAYTGLLAAALDTADVPLLPAAPLPVAAVAAAALVGVIARTRRLWPPLRGPPAHAA